MPVDLRKRTSANGRESAAVGWGSRSPLLGSLCRADGCALPRDGALGGAELRRDVADGYAAGGEAANHLLLFDCGEVVVADVVPGERAFNGDLVDVVPL